MRKKGILSIVEALEQRRLLSGALAPANYDSVPPPIFGYHPPSSGDDNSGGDLGVSGATFPASVPAGPDSSFDLDPAITGIDDQYADDVQVRVALSKSGVWDQQDQQGDNIYLGDTGNHVLPGEISLSHISPGTYHVLLGVDYFWALSLNDNPSNNRVDAGMLTVTPNDSADMGVTGATFPSSVPAGSSFDLEPTVVQTGPMASVDYTIVSELSPDTNWVNASRIFLSTPDNFQSGQAAVPQTTPPGAYHLLLEVFPKSGDGAPTDTDPGDDILDAGIIAITPDRIDNMAVLSATVSRTVSAAGTITVTPTVFRSGALANADYNISVALSNDSTWGNDDDVILTPASSNPGVPFTGGEMTVPSGTPAGGYYARIHVSPWSADPNAPPPSDQIPADDTLQSGYVNVPAADMSVTAATYPTTAPAGTDIDVEPTVVRTGQLSNADYLISVALSKNGVWDSDNLNLSPDSATPDFHGGYVKVPSMVSGETYHLLVKVTPYQDSQGNPLPTEANLANNILDAGSITITPNWTPPSNPVIPPWNPPIDAPRTGDDSVTATTFPSTAEAGKKIDIEPTVSQTGGLANVDYNISVELSTTGNWGDSGNFELDPDNADAPFGIERSFHSGNVVVPADVPAGNYQVLVQVQPSQQLTPILGTPVDTNSADDVLNAGTIAITANDSDLGLTGASFPATAAAGSDINVEPTIVRSGEWIGASTPTKLRVLLSPNGDWNNSANIELPLALPPGDFNLFFNGGEVIIPANVASGNYHVLMEINPTNPLNIDGVVEMPENPPPDANPSDNQIDAGAIAVTGLAPPEQSPTLKATVGQRFTCPPPTNGKIQQLYLSTDDKLQLPATAPKKLLKLGTAAIQAPPDVRLKFNHQLQANVPDNATTGFFNLLGIAKKGNQTEVINLGAIEIDPAAPVLSAVVRPKGKKATAGGTQSIKLTIRNTGLVDAINAPINLYFSSERTFSEDDTPLAVAGLSSINLAARHSFSKSYLIDLPATLPIGEYYILACTGAAGSAESIGSTAKPINVSSA